MQQLWCLSGQISITSAGWLPSGMIHADDKKQTQKKRPKPLSPSFFIDFLLFFIIFGKTPKFRVVKFILL